MLGIEIARGMENVNWDSRLPAIKGKLLRWEDRALTFTGKILVIKAEILASLTHLATTLPVPRAFQTTLRRSIFQFIWGSHQDYLKREIMYKPLEKEGEQFQSWGLNWKPYF